MHIVAGVDGCPAGWICITLDLDCGTIRSAVYRTAADLICQQPTPEIIAVDIPIGLSDKSDRDCDRMARKFLGRPRASSVFPAPIRPAILAKSREEACRLTRAADGRAVGAQAWGIFRKIREIDEALRADPARGQRVRKVHPEVSFWAWNGNRPMIHGKNSPEGKVERRALIASRWGDAVIDRVRSSYPAGQVGTDDIHDAFAALCTAKRIHAGTAGVIPDNLGYRNLWFEDLVLSSPEGHLATQLLNSEQGRSGIA